MNWEMFSICLKGIFDAWIFRITPGSSAFITLHSSTPCGERVWRERRARMVVERVSECV